MQRLSDGYDKLLNGMVISACIILLAMVLIICGDVLLRNVPISATLRGLSWSTDLSEYGLYLVTMLTAPWLLRRGQHIRVDIALRALPSKFGWILEWIADLIGFVCCIYIAISGIRAVSQSFEIGAMMMKSLVIPEWWLLLPLPITFVLLAIETLFRMHRLTIGERRMRDDAVSAS